MVAGRSAPAPGCRHRFLAIFPGHGEFATRRRPVFINSAVNGVADIARQGRAAALALIGAAHAAQERVSGSVSAGHQAARIVGFRPVEKRLENTHNRHRTSCTG